MDKLGVIDLGTNTFHLLIATVAVEGEIKTCYRERHFVKLAEAGIEEIGAQPFQRGLEAMQKFRKAIDLYQVRQVKAIGTAALRTARNGQQFIDTINKATGIRVQLIDGDEEARLIYLGVRQAIPFAERNYLIMDIGGGSVEFMIANNDSLKWYQSFPIGVAVLYRLFHRHEPILPNDIDALNDFLEERLLPLRKEILKYQPTTLVGAAGTFDVLENVLEVKSISPNGSMVAIKDFRALYNIILPMDQVSRLNSDKIPDSRADMIVVALILIHAVLSYGDFQQIIVSSYAMKEGVLRELQENGFS